MKEKIVTVDYQAVVPGSDRPIDRGAFVPIKPIIRDTKSKVIVGRLMTCYKCGNPGGTMVKDDKGYKHSASSRCVPGKTVITDKANIPSQESSPDDVNPPIG